MSLCRRFVAASFGCDLLNTNANISLTHRSFSTVSVITQMEEWGYSLSFITAGIEADHDAAFPFEVSLVEFSKTSHLLSNFVPGHMNERLSNTPPLVMFWVAVALGRSFLTGCFALGC